MDVIGCLSSSPEPMSKCFMPPVDLRRKEEEALGRTICLADKRDGLSWVYHQKIQDNHSDLVRPMDIYMFFAPMYAYAHHFR